ncbi:MAG TPA: NADH-quinone oxidoreductase subunit A [Acidimicrobiales bacterium]
MADYLPLLALGVLAYLFASMSFVASRLLAPRRPTVAKEAPYECGIVPGREPPERFPVRFYLVAMIFIMFDVEIIFLFPWAVRGEGLGTFAFYEVLVFSVIFFAAFVYLIARGGLEWGPRKATKRLEVAAMPGVPSTSIRRVGLEGREFIPTVAAPAGTGDGGDAA